MQQERGGLNSNVDVQAWKVRISREWIADGDGVCRSCKRLIIYQSTITYSILNIRLFPTAFSPSSFINLRYRKRVADNRLPCISISQCILMDTNLCIGTTIWGRAI
jgi:hypothetical protein